MRLLLTTIMAFASVDVSIGQAPVMVSDVGKLITTVSHLGSAYSVYEYEGVHFSGDLSITEYREAVNLLKPAFSGNEKLEEVIVSQHVPAVRAQPDGKDLQVRTCLARCEGKFDRGASGKLYVLERADGKLRVFKVLGWIE